MDYGSGFTCFCSGVLGVLGFALLGFGFGVDS